MKLVMEKLNSKDKAEVRSIAKSLVKSEAEKAIKQYIKDQLEKEMARLIKKKGKAREEVSIVARNLIKKLYRELSFSYPHILDRIKISENKIIKKIYKAL